MGQKREIIRQYVGAGLRLSDALQIAKMSKSSYYYKRKFSTGGRTKTNHTCHNGQLVCDDQVVRRMREILGQEFIDYGYRKLTVQLKREGYDLGKKKVYRLMFENNFLNPVKIKESIFDKEIIRSKPKATKPLEIIELDIKYVYINADNRHAYLMTLLDVFHREAYCWTLSYSMSSRVAIDLILEFVDNHIIPSGVEPSTLELSFRTDNGSQFTAKAYRRLMKKFHFKAVYIPPATPQLNGHIESFHSTVQKLVCNKYEFKSIYDAQIIFKRFFNTYNNIRILTCLLNLPPRVFIKQWQLGYIGLKEHNNKILFFFKEEGNDKTNSIYSIAFAYSSINDSVHHSPPSFEVNLNLNSGFLCGS